MDDTGTVPNVGSHIRKILESRKPSLRALLKPCGLSANAISLIERRKNSLAVSSLHRLATAMEVPITDFYQERTRINARLVKQARDLRFQNNSATLESLDIGLTNQQFEPFRMTVTPEVDNLNDPIAPPGEEFVHYQEGW